MIAGIAPGPDERPDYYECPACGGKGEAGDFFWKTVYGNDLAECAECGEVFTEEQGKIAPDAAALDKKIQEYEERCAEYDDE